MKWWILQDPGSQPYGVLAQGDDLKVRRYVPGTGLVYAPGYGDYVWLGEPGAYRAEPEEALALIRSGTLPAVNHLDPAESADVPVLPVPDSVPVGE